MNPTWLALHVSFLANGRFVLFAVWSETYRDLSREDESPPEHELIGREVRAFTAEEAKRLYDQGKLVGWTPSPLNA